MTAPVIRQSAPVVELRSVVRRYGGLTAVNGVSLSLHAGEVVAVVGDNGAGKSTVSKMIAGVEHPDEGTIAVNGEPRRIGSALEARRLGIEVVYQDLALAPNLNVVSNLFLGREIVGFLGWLDRRRMARETRELLEALDVGIPSLRVRVERLSGGQRQAIAIARATHWARTLVVMDEPTAALGLRETRKVEALIQQMRVRGLAVMIVSHNLDQVFRVADRVAVMRRGELVAQFATADSTPQEVIAAITGVA
jgi:simple sugar transport system ATP-binding protein